MEEKRIIVAGAGFGGVAAALTLAKDPAIARSGYDIVLIDRHPRHLYTAGLYEAAAVPRGFAKDAYLASSLGIPIAEIIRGRPIRFLHGAMAGLDVSGRRVVLDNGGALSYAYLVVALGSETNYFDIPGLHGYSIPLKSADDAVRLGNAIERAAGERPSLTILVGGAGATGVELAAELINFLCVLEKEKNPTAPACRTTVILVEASEAILPGFDARSVRRASRRLAHLGVILKTGSPIIAVSKGDITLRTGERVRYDILVWTGGIIGPALCKTFGLTLSSRGTLVTDAALRAAGAVGRIFAAGDDAGFPRPRTGKPLPATAQIAVSQGIHAARNISRVIRGKPVRRFRPQKKYPFVLAIGRKYALADLASLRIGGLPGWCIKQIVQLKYFLFILPWARALSLWWENMRLYHSND